MKSIIKRLSGLKPSEFVSEFNYNEKVCLLQSLVDGIHDLRSFVSILSQRVEEKTAFNKEKMEIFQSIKTLEQEQMELVKKQMEPEYLEWFKKLEDEHDELEKVVANANRADARKMKERIAYLRSEMHTQKKKLTVLDDQIKRKQQ